MLKNAKQCTRCGLVKSLGSYGRCAAASDGHMPQCRSCRKNMRAGYNERNREANRLAAKEYYKANRKQHNEKSRAYQKKHKTALIFKQLARRSAHRDQISRKAKAAYKANRQAMRLREAEQYKCAPWKTAARNQVHLAIEADMLMREPCEICGVVVAVEAHHEDYAKPLEVHWLCRPHHRRLHAGWFALLPARVEGTVRIIAEAIRESKK